MQGFATRFVTVIIRLTLLVSAVCVLPVWATQMAPSTELIVISSDINVYSSVQYTANGTQSRKLIYSPSYGAPAVLTMTVQGRKLVMNSGQERYRSLFHSEPKNGDYSQLKSLFFNSDDQERLKDLNEDIVDSDKELQQLRVEISKETDNDTKREKNNEMAQLVSEQQQLQQQVSRLNNRSKQLILLPVYDTAQVFAHRFQTDFFLIEGDYLQLIRTTTGRENYTDSLSKQALMISEIRYDVVAQARISQKKITSNKRTNKLLLKIYQDTLLGFNYGQKQLILTRLVDDSLTKFAQMLNTLALEPSRLAFKGEQLFTRYLWSKETEYKTLEVDYKETGKRKNLIQVRVSAQTNVFDPKVQSTVIEKHIGVLAIAKGDRLIELKKVQTINGKKDTSWDQDIRNGIIKLGQETIFVSKEEYYGYEGLWYLASWMKTNNIAEKKIFLINGTEPISLTASLTHNGVVDISKSGNSLYQFSVDKNGFVTRLYFVPLEQELLLISKETTTTKANKEKVKRYMQSNKVVLK